MQAFLPQQSKQGIRMKIGKAKASITIQMVCESLKIVGKVVVALPQSQCPVKTRSEAPFVKDILGGKDSRIFLISTYLHVLSEGFSFFKRMYTPAVLFLLSCWGVCVFLSEIPLAIVFLGSFPLFSHK